MLGLFLLHSSAGAWAREADLDPEGNLDRVRNSIATLETSLANQTVEFESARSQVLDIERRLHLAKQENKNFTRELAAKNLKIRALAERRETLKREYSETAKAVSDIVVASTLR